MPYRREVIVLALLFIALVYFVMGGESAPLFLTAYLIEKSLLIDNVFVFTFHHVRSISVFRLLRGVILRHIAIPRTR